MAPHQRKWLQVSPLQAWGELFTGSVLPEASGVLEEAVGHRCNWPLCTAGASCWRRHLGQDPVAGESTAMQELSAGETTRAAEGQD